MQRMPKSARRVLLPEESVGYKEPPQAVLFNIETFWYTILAQVCGYRIAVIILVFQTRDAGSTPATRSTKIVFRVKAIFVLCSTFFYTSSMLFRHAGGKVTTIYAICYDSHLNRMAATATAAIPKDVVIDLVFHDNRGTWFPAYMLMVDRGYVRDIKLLPMNDEQLFALEDGHRSDEANVQEALRSALVRLARQDPQARHVLLVTHAPHPGLQAVEKGLAHQVRPGDAVIHYIELANGTLEHAIHYVPCPLRMPG